jgi:hypothetical protein
VYEDLGINSNTVLDPGFNMNNFKCLDMVEDHPERFLAMQCSLSGSVNVIGNARGEGSRQSSGQQTPQSNAGLSGFSSIVVVSSNNDSKVAHYIVGPAMFGYRRLGV